MPPPPGTPREPPAAGRSRRVLSCNRCFYLDDSNGAAVANRALLRCLARAGLAVEALSGTVVDAGAGPDPAAVLAARGLPFSAGGGDRWQLGPAGVSTPDPPRLRAVVDGFPLTIHHRPLSRLDEPNEVEC